MLKFTVSDSGCGIPKKRHKDIFKLLDFSQFRNSYNSNKITKLTTKLAGTGLGISQKIANNLNSKIEFTSIIDTGSKFYFTLKAGTKKSSSHLKLNSTTVKNLKRGIKKEPSPKDLTHLEIKPELVNIEINPKTKCKRSLSIDEGNGNYEKVNIQMKKEKFNLIDIDHIYKDLAIEDNDANIMTDIEKETLFLNKYSRVSLVRQDMSDGSFEGLEVPQEDGINQFSFRPEEFGASIKIGRSLRDSITPKSTRKYFDNSLKLKPKEVPDSSNEEKKLNSSQSSHTTNSSHKCSYPSYHNHLK